MKNDVLTFLGSYNIRGPPRGPRLPPIEKANSQNLDATPMHEGSNRQVLGVLNHLDYRVSSKTVPTWLFALLSVSTRANCKSWDIFEKFRKFAT